MVMIKTKTVYIQHYFRIELCIHAYDDDGNKAKRNGVLGVAMIIIIIMAVLHLMHRQI